MTLTAQQIQDFKQIIFPYYYEKARDLPWRKTEDPYAILVSEIMLQQTQVPRVIEKYKAWIKRFPTHFDLAKASLSTILPFWTGLGYNRRARYLKLCADEIVMHYHGIFPTSPEALRKLPGIGPYTSQSICVFAYDQPHPLIETNVRTIYIHHFFPNRSEVDDNELLPFVLETMDKEHPRKWFNALMDYGTYLKMQLPNPSRKSTTYTKQSPLKGSVREVRGWILRQLSAGSDLSLTEIQTVFSKDDPRVPKAIAGLVKDGLIVGEDVFHLE